MAALVIPRDSANSFRNWLKFAGHRVRDGFGDYELFQIHYGGHWMAVYRSDKRPQYATVDNRLLPLVEQFQESREFPH